MTDKEIIELVEYYKETADEITIAELSFDEMSNILDLINRQQAENERLNNELHSKVEYIHEQLEIIESKKAEIEKLKAGIEEEHSISQSYSDLCDYQQKELERLKYNLKAVLDERADHTEAIKEFAERVKKLTEQTAFADCWSEGGFLESIDNLVKEMVGDESDT